MKNENIAIIGGGLAGLAAANYLARAGRRVDLYERSEHLGGRARTFNEHGALFNLGPHALFRHGAAAAVLRELGISFNGHSPRATGLVVHRSALHRLPAGLPALLGADWLSWRAKWEIAGFLARLGSLRADSVTFAEWLGRFVDPKSRAFVAALACVATYANHPKRMSAAAALEQIRLAVRGVLYLDGGWQTLVDGLRERAETSGVRVHSSSPVEAVMRHGGVRAVKLAGGHVEPAGSVIMAVSPAVAESLTGVNFTRGLVPVRAATLDIALRRLPHPHCTFALNIDRPMYYSVHSAVAKLTESGGFVIHLLKYLEAGDNGRGAEPELEALLDLCQPGWRTEVMARRFLPSLTVSNAVVIGPRPGVCVPDVDGLYIAGDWVGPEGMLADAALAGARAAALAILANTDRRALAKSA